MLIYDSNAQITKFGEMFQIIDIATGLKHLDCEIDLFETYDIALQYMNSDNISSIKVKCGACEEQSLLSEWNDNCPTCKGEFKDLLL